MPKKRSLEDSFIELARLALTGRRIDVENFLRFRATKTENSVINTELRKLLIESPTAATPIRSIEKRFTPLNDDTLASLVRVENPCGSFREPVWNPFIDVALNQFTEERHRQAELVEMGLFPSRTLLFTGPPGVGKTLSARWIAEELGRPLIILDLASVMSSYLGKTGNNLREALNYAKSLPSVFLLDELDAVATRRDEQNDIGELKRLVTVLLQEIDDWPGSGILIAATNHPELLDRAVWRRFDGVIEFPLPEVAQIETFLVQLLPGADEEAQKLIGPLANAMKGISFSDIELKINARRRSSILRGMALAEGLRHLLEETRTKSIG